MKYRFRLIFLLIIACLAFPERSPAPVVFKAGKGVKYQAPGEEEISGTARELFEKGQRAEAKGNFKRAIKCYQRIARKYPRDTLAPGAAFRTGQLQEQTDKLMRAAEAYRYVVEKYPQSPHFDEAIEAQFRIGQVYLGGRKKKVLGIPVANALDQAVEIFAAIVRTAPYGKHTARAQFNIGLAREKQEMNDAAIAAFQAVVDKFPEDPVAADAQYQIGYIWYEAARAGTRDSNAVKLAKIGFQDFLFRYPNSEKAPQARENLSRLENKQTSDAFGIAKFYDKQKNYRAAVIYYNDVIRQQPGSAQGDEAKKRIDELRAKVGDAALQSPVVTADARKKKSSTLARASEGQEDAPEMRASPTDIAPLPPPEADVSLPPPASLTPDNTTAPGSSPAPETSPAPEPSPSPEASPTPEDTVSPTP
jgi:outer membrane protein assembly factor BamD